MAAKEKLSWYGVRSLYRLTAFGKPKAADKHFDPDSTLIEDRIVLFRAKNGDDACRQAEAEARHYAQSTRYTNIYGQRVRLRYLNALHCFEMIHAPKIEAEVYSTTSLLSRSTADSAVISQRLG